MNQIPPYIDRRCGRRLRTRPGTAPKELRIMTEANTANIKAKTEKHTGSSFGLPNSENPKFDLSKMEMPAAFREFADKGVAQSRNTYENAKATEEATDLLKGTYKTAAKGATDYNLKVMEIARTNTNSAFDYAYKLMGVKSPSEFIELSTAHAHKQFEAMNRADQGAHRARPKGNDRDRRADQGRHHKSV